MERFQKTLASGVTFTGKGLHSGRMVRMEVLPATADFGIVFQRTDLEASRPLRAHVTEISSTDLCTTIGSGANSVATIEHILAAIAGLGIDNALIKINGPEVPIMDGSAEPFVKKFLTAGFKVLGAERRVYQIKKAFELRNGDQFICVTPAKKSRVRCSIDFKRSIIGFQTIEYRPSPENFLKVSDARTFCHLNDVNLMRQQGLALGGSLDNAVVVTDDNILNEGGLRSSNEFVRHKLLDMIGDLSLMGFSLSGEIAVHKPGHGLHAKFMKALWERREEFLELVPVSALHAEERMDETREVLPEEAVFAFG